MALRNTDMVYARFHNCKARILAPLMMVLCLFVISCESGSDTQSSDLGASASLSHSEKNQLTLPPEISSGDPANPRQKLQGLKGLKGVNVDQLFSQNIRDTDKRFDRLEDAFVDFRREFEDVKPEIIRLVAIEKDIQTLIDMLSNDLNIPQQSPQFANTPMMPGPQNGPVPLGESGNNMMPAQQPMAAPAPQPQAQAQQTPPPAPTAAAPAVTLTNLRYGEHSTYTRFVIDATTQTSYSASVDSSGKNLIIKIPASAWSGPTSKTYNNSLLQSHNVQNANGETTVTISFKQAISISNQGTLTKDTAPKFRIFVDIR